MFKTAAEAIAYVNELAGLLTDARDVDIVIAPSFLALHAAASAAKGGRIAVAAQNMHWEREGPFTGEVSAAMIRETGARYVIVGHSERRTLFGETNLTVNRKVSTALGAELVPIMCVGETLDQREASQTLAVLDQQLREGLDRVTADQLSGMVIAYEPVWAIGTGRNATPAQAQDAHAHIRARLKQWFGADASERCRILYGGSVKPENIANLTTQADVDGALVGGASLDPRAFADIVKKASA
jgi:triosephosphate isomerase